MLTARAILVSVKLVTYVDNQDMLCTQNMHSCSSASYDLVFMMCEQTDHVPVIVCCIAETPSW